MLCSIICLAVVVCNIVLAKIVPECELILDFTVEKQKILNFYHQQVLTFYGTVDNTLHQGIVDMNQCGSLGMPKLL